jgi:uncharacterized protein YdaU (DUF1376 family)
MKHYPHHIGDFDKATRHLTRIERSIYRDLLDLYYDTEQPLILEMAALCRKIIARSNEESTAVEQVLNEFFTQTPTGWYHDRCEAEIEAYRNNNSQKAQAGKASAEAKRLKKQQALNGDSTAVEQPLPAVATNGNGASTNHQPSTINHQPSTNMGDAPRKRSTPTPAIAKPDDVAEQTWADWLALRKAKRAPVTETVINGARAESVKAFMTLDGFLQVWCRRGSQGLEAAWLRPEERASPRSQPISFAQQDEQARRARWEEMTGRKWPDADTVPEFIEAEETTRRIAA